MAPTVTVTLCRQKIQRGGFETHTGRRSSTSRVLDESSARASADAAHPNAIRSPSVRPSTCPGAMVPGSPPGRATVSLRSLSLLGRNPGTWEPAGRKAAAACGVTNLTAPAGVAGPRADAPCVRCPPDFGSSITRPEPTRRDGPGRTGPVLHPGGFRLCQWPVCMCSLRTRVGSCA